MFAIRQVMNKNVVAVSPEMTVGETIEFLTKHHIGGVPVVNGEGSLVGMISELALIDVVFDEEVKNAPVSEFMTTLLHVVHPNDSLTRAAQLFTLYAFRRLPVVEDGKLVAILTRRDLMNFALQSGHVLGDPLIELIPSLAQAVNCQSTGSPIACDPSCIAYT